MAHRGYFCSWMDKNTMDPETNVLIQEYANGIREFMVVAQQQTKAIKTCKLNVHARLVIII